jgi:PPM family protein phosphatase
MVKVHGFGHSDVGKRREKNEDSFLIDDDLGLFIVADGMGGHLGGEYASQLAVTTIKEVLQILDEDPEATLVSELEIDPENMAERFRYAIRVASMKIFEEATHDPTLRGMGTTAVGVFVRNGVAYIANVGDSRCYQFRNEQCEQITQDHSLVSEQLRAGLITLQDAETHKYKNIITRSVGYQEDVESDIWEIKLEPGDRYLLCSDGLTNMVSDDVIAKLVNSNSSETACRALVNEANKNGGDDNVTAAICEVYEDENGSEQDQTV